MSVTKLPSVFKTSPTEVELHESKVQTQEERLFNNGRSYVVGSSKVAHQLPAPSALRPYMERKSGEMDTWPAGKSCGQVFVDTQLTSSPKLLLKLEAYLQKELRVLECSGACAVSLTNEKRLQPFREVFEYLIENFRTYKPLLSSIKHEYEAMLASQKGTIQQLEPLKAMLVTTNEQCERKLLSIKQEEKHELLQLKATNANLKNTITSQREEIASLQQQVKKCQVEIGNEYQKYRDEMDARKLLIQDLNDLKYQQEEFKKVLLGQATDGQEGKKEDAVVLRIALRKTQEQLEVKSQRLTQVLTDYGDVVPRREFEMLEKQLQTNEGEFEELKKNNGNLMKEHSTLIDIHKEIVGERDRFEADCNRMRQNATPRPEWDKCGLYVDGGPERWNQITTETSSNDKVELLLSEFTGQDLAAIKSGVGVVDYFEPKGMDDTIPAYLQTTERVRNRRLNKRDLLTLIKDVWDEKMREEGAQPFTPHSNMAEYFKKFLQLRFGVEAMVIEWGYNIHDALTRYSHNKNVKMFADILNGEIDEDNHYNELYQLENLFRALADADQKDSGVLSVKEFSDCIKEHFSFMTNDEKIKSQLLEAATQELGSDEVTENGISFKELFTEDDEGGSGDFVSLVRLLHEGDKNNMIAEIESHFEKKTEITTSELQDVFFQVAPKLFDSEEEAVQRSVKLAFREAHEAGIIDRTSLINNLKRSCVSRS